MENPVSDRYEAERALSLKKENLPAGRFKDIFDRVSGKPVLRDVYGFCRRFHCFLFWEFQSQDTVFVFGHNVFCINLFVYGETPSERLIGKLVTYHFGSILLLFHFPFGADVQDIAIKFNQKVFLFKSRGR